MTLAHAAQVGGHVLASRLGERGRADAESRGFARSEMLATASSMLSAPPRMVVSSLIAVVCSGIASRKWRTISTSANAVQPWLPCSNGRQRSRPRNAIAPPSAGLSFSGLTEQALPEGTTSLI
jgi:hypothetical protein